MRQIPEEYLVKREQDIQEAEGIFVHTPSAFALENLFNCAADVMGPVKNCNIAWSVRYGHRRHTS